MNNDEFQRAVWDTFSLLTKSNKLDNGAKVGVPDSQTPIGYLARELKERQAKPKSDVVIFGRGSRKDFA